MPDFLILPAQQKRIESLEQEITRLAGHINAINYRFLMLLGEFDEAGGWKDDGILTFAHWLNWKCGIGAVAAREKIRVARALRALPQTREAFRLGELSYSKVREMTRVATPDNEASLLNIARYGTAAHMAQVVRKYRRCRNSDNCHEYQKQPSMTVWQDEQGMLHINAKLPAEEGELLVQAIDRMARQVDREATGDVSAETSVEATENVSAETSEEGFCTRTEALCRIAEHYLASPADISGEKTLNGADRYEVVLHINDNARHIDCDIEKGPATYLDSNRFLAPEVARKLACDATVTVLTENDKGHVLNIGRRNRTVPHHMRMALKLRDHGCCRFPGCNRNQWTDAHHIQHWADGGETRLSNLITLCRRHHTLLHQGEFTIEAAGNNFLFYDSTREEIPVIADAYSEPGEDLVAAIMLEQSRLDIDDRTAITKWLGESIDYSQAIDALIELDGLTQQ